MGGLSLKLGNGRRFLLSVMGFLAALLVFYQFWAFPCQRYFSDSSPIIEASSLSTMSSRLQPENLVISRSFGLVNGVSDNANDGDEDNKGGSASDKTEIDVDLRKDMLRNFRTVDVQVKNLCVEDLNISVNSSNGGVCSKNVEDTNDVSLSTNLSGASSQIDVDRMGRLRVEPNSFVTSLLPSFDFKQIVDLEPSKNRGLEPSWKNDSLRIERYVEKMRGATVTISTMKSMLHNGHGSSTSVKRKRLSSRDHELHSAGLQIKKAPLLKNFSQLHTPLFRNISMFVRSYELMVRLLKIYVYKEGEKPIFHQPRVRGIYAAEGWFMKLIERSRHFIVRDPKKAHLFYFPFSSDVLRSTLYDEKSHSMKNLEHYLSDYVNLIKRKHPFWNRTGGADHFFVACHDWGPRITRPMNNCIRALCNANVARGFSVGKDVSLPVTYVRSGNEPTIDIGGKQPSERNILAFFAGQMHGYVRPLLLQYWENKTSDMKIFGPMRRDVESKAVYRDYMKSSKYCICARGYGVHTPRVVESIFYECVPVIISDNYIPPFFEVLDWEAFAIFVLEKDIPNLRNILLAIPEEKYRDMQVRVKMVQRHFIWHKIPERYDLFHMILHSIWFSRVSQMRPM